MVWVGARRAGLVLAFALGDKLATLRNTPVAAAGLPVQDLTTDWRCLTRTRMLRNNKPRWYRRSGRAYASAAISAIFDVPKCSRKSMPVSSGAPESDPTARHLVVVLEDQGGSDPRSRNRCGRAIPG